MVELGPAAREIEPQGAQPVLTLAESPGSIDAKTIHVSSAEDLFPVDIGAGASVVPAQAHLRVRVEDVEFAWTQLESGPRANPARLRPSRSEARNLADEMRARRTTNSRQARGDAGAGSSVDRSC